MANKVYVIGVGMTKFEKPGGARAGTTPTWRRRPAPRRSPTPGIDYDEIEQAYVGYVYGDSTSGQRAVYELGLTGIPVVNVNNNCSTGSTALYLAAQVDRRRAGRLRAGAGLREDAAGLARDRRSTTATSRWCKHIARDGRDLRSSRSPPAP